MPKHVYCLNFTLALAFTGILLVVFKRPIPYIDRKQNPEQRAIDERSKHTSCLAPPPSPLPQVQAASSCMSSATLLNLLSSRASSLAGERTSAALVHKLLEAAGEPYFRMLELWLTQGELDDPYKEFMIEVRRGEEQSSRRGDRSGGGKEQQVG
jgi:hypothetical protein